MPAPMRLGPSMMAPGPTVTSGASSTSGAMRAVGSMGMVGLAEQFPQIVILQKIIRLPEEGQGVSRASPPRNPAQEIELQKVAGGAPEQLPGLRAAALP